MNQRPSNLPRLAAFPASMFAIWLGGNADQRTRERRSVVTGVAVSLLLHAGLLLLTIHARLDAGAPPGSGPHEISVRLAPPRPPSPRPAPEESVPKAAQKPQPPRPRPRSRIVAVPKSKSPLAVPQDPEPQVAPPAPQQPPLVEMDMADIVARSRARRQQAEDEAARENAAAAGPSPTDIALANIRRSAQQGKRDGTGGVFEITHKGVRSATFVFRGWNPAERNAIHQSFEVDAGIGGNVEMAIVRRMIQMIRSHYSGDFNWDSHRLGRVVVKSARPQDNDELERFLMAEFFGSDVQAR